MMKIRTVACATALAACFVWAGYAKAQVSSGAQADQLAFFGVARKAVHDKPFFADMTVRKVWQLGDGTTISQEMKGVVARSSKGELREDLEDTYSRGNTGPTFLNAFIYHPETDTEQWWRLVARSDRDKTVLENKMIIQPTPKPIAAGQTATSTAKPPSDGPNTNNNLAHLLASAPPPATFPLLRSTNTDATASEDLGQQSINGVLATGKRHTITIPEGKIGNDRPIHIISEVWTSVDYGIVVKCVDSDPRTGTRTMELTGFSTMEPDAALFQPPAEYKIVTDKDLLNMQIDRMKAQDAQSTPGK